MINLRYRVRMEVLVPAPEGERDKYVVTVEDTHFKITSPASSDEGLSQKFPHLEIFTNKQESWERFNELEMEYC